MMKKNGKSVLGVSLLGIDERSRNLLTMFFKGPCGGLAQIVDDAIATIDIIDTHFVGAERLLEQSLARIPPRSVIVLAAPATARIERDNVIYLEKPVKAALMMAALDWANEVSLGNNKPKPNLTIAVPPPNEMPIEELRSGASELKETLNRPTAKALQVDVPPPPIEQKKIISSEAQQKIIKYAASIAIDEENFAEVIGVVSDININDVNNRHLAAYDAKYYYQSYVQAAYKSSMIRAQSLQLNCLRWKPLVILPHSHEVWIDADDRLLKEIAGVPIEARAMSVSSVGLQLLQQSGGLEKIQDMHVFLWKLALWTSKGRYPKTIDIDRPVYLKQWPDFARYVITPHALRIAGLLVTRGPQTMIEIANLLKIELCYVYIFISASHAIGLASQAKRQADTLTQVTLPTTVPAKKSLFSRILDKLRRR